MKEWIVGAGEAGGRLDRALVARARASRQRVKQWLDTGRVRVNGRGVRIAKWTVRAGDRLAVDEGPVAPARRERRAARRPLRLLYEDAALLAIDKPPGMLVVPEVGAPAPTVVDAARAHLMRRFPGARGTHVRALHRLDRGTSGVVLLAKTRAAEDVIQQFKRHAVRREYVAIVRGAVAGPGGTIRLPLAKGRFGHGRKAAALPEGKAAVTHYAVEERYRDAALLTVQVETGRTHQIRVHLAAIGHPLIGDDLYGPPGRVPGALPSGRVALHATRLKFRHPATGAVVDVRSPLPPDLKRLVDTLRGE